MSFEFCLINCCALPSFRLKELKDEQARLKEEQLEEAKLKDKCDIVDSSSLQSDEAFISKESSQEELENDRLYNVDNLAVPKERDSEELVLPLYVI